MTSAAVGGTVESQRTPIESPNRMEVVGETGARMKAAIATERPR
jgi:hypothetical protein